VTRYHQQCATKSPFLGLSQIFSIKSIFFDISQFILIRYLVRTVFSFIRCAVLAFPGIITLWLAIGVGDIGLSLAVILSALRIGSR
jgi:hypothetical protein